VSNSPHFFADRVANIALTGTLVRLEFGVMQAPVAEGQKQQLLPSQTLVMPLDGFLASFGMMEGMVKKLVADGVVKTKPQEAESEAPPSRKKK
jgi:hypothetical protein